MFMLRGKSHIPCHIPSREQISQIYDQNDFDNFYQGHNHRGQPVRSAMDQPLSRETAFMITVNLCAR